MAAFSPLVLIALVCAALAVLLLAGFLIVRPALDARVKLWLLLALGIFPLGVAFSGNVQGYEATKARVFCGSCHVMARHAADSNDLGSVSLAARHGRNRLFGDENCYTCHADYGMYGTVLTKIGGMRHVWLYYTQYRDIPIDEALPTIHLVKPYPNANCMECHSTTGTVWRDVPDHVASLEDVRSGAVSCASPGCHGFAHPFTKPAQALHPDAGSAPPARAPAVDGGAR